MNERAAGATHETPASHWLERARAFHGDDPDPDTRAELAALLERATTAGDVSAQAELRERFSARLEFGTAGLRGLLGAGDNRMNRRVIAQTTAALCAQLQDEVPNATERGLCIGFDGRHKSREFAEEVQAIANAAGFVVHAFETPAPTPLLAYAVLACGAAAGVMVTASHNPAAYNGYKVYWCDGAQLNTPFDARIAARIVAAAQQSVLALSRLPLSAARSAGRWHSLDVAHIRERYLAGLRDRLGAAASSPAPSIAYTALHGVGEQAARAALTIAGVTELASVAEQAAPDPDFPSVRFPNPEEPGALDRVLALADRIHAQLVLANDPDADRLAAAIRTPDDALHTLSGNELGLLLSDYLLARAPDDGKNAIVTTIVSTPLTAAVAHAHAARLEITLTGFKWIVRRALELERAGLRCVLGFEEALGFAIGDLVRDKDGIAAAAHVARMSQWHAAQGSTLYAALEALYRRHGFVDSRQCALTLSADTDRAALRDRIWQLRTQTPTHIADLPVTARRDLLQPPPETNLPATDAFVLELDHAHRVTIRPSGTEPKLKIYLDCATTLAASDALPQVRTRLQHLSERIALDLRQRLGL